MTMRYMGGRVALILLLVSPNALAADHAGWQKLIFSHYKPTEFTIVGEEIHIVSESASSMLYRPLSDIEREKDKLSWSWNVESSNVTPTPLDVVPGDDRIVGIYVFFTVDKPDGGSQSLPHHGKYIAYVWGGDHAAGDVVKSKDGNGRFITVRPNDTRQRRWYREALPYKHDFARIFGHEAYPAFIAIAADTDDTHTKTSSIISGLSFY